MRIERNRYFPEVFPQSYYPRIGPSPVNVLATREAFGFSRCVTCTCDVNFFVCGDMRIVKWRIKEVGE